MPPPEWSLHWIKSSPFPISSLSYIINNSSLTSAELFSTGSGKKVFSHLRPLDYPLLTFPRETRAIIFATDLLERNRTWEFILFSFARKLPLSERAQESWMLVPWAKVVVDFLLYPHWENNPFQKENHRNVFSFPDSPGSWNDGHSSRQNANCFFQGTSWL